MSSLGLLSSARLRQVRRLEELAPALYDSACLRRLDSNLPVYEIYRDCCDDQVRDLLRKYGLRYDVTVIPPLLLGEEYVKTLGHFPLPSGVARVHPEVFEVLEGQARFLVQKYQGEQLVDVSLVVAQEGDTVLIPPGSGYVMINASPGRMVVGHLASRSCVEAYDQYVEKRGAAFYFLTGSRLVRNLNYSSVPRVRVLRAETPPFLEGGLGLLQAFLKDPDRFTFLNELSIRAEWDVLERSQLPLVSRNLLIFANVFLATYAALMFLTILSMVITS